MIDIRGHDYMAEKKAEKGRIWACVVYRESCSEDWLAKVENLHIPCYISPLHDRDEKKEHWHCMFLFQGQKTREIVKDLFKSFGGVGAELVHHKQAYLLYLCHLASDDKVTYNKDDVIALNGATPYEMALDDVALSHYDIIGEMIEWCSCHTTYFCDLVDYARSCRKDWFKVLCDRNSHLLWEYIKSKTWQKSQEECQGHYIP